MVSPEIGTVKLEVGRTDCRFRLRYIRSPRKVSLRLRSTSEETV